MASAWATSPGLGPWPSIEHSATTEAELEDNLDRVKQIGLDTREVLEAGDLSSFGEMLTRQWQLKYERGPGGLHDQVDGWIRAGVDAGFICPVRHDATSSSYLSAAASYRRTRTICVTSRRP